MMKKNNLKHFLFLCLIINIILLPFGSVVKSADISYPKLGYFTFYKATSEWAAKFDFIITGQSSTSYAREIKAINPNAKIVITRDWQYAAGRQGDIPPEWLVKNSKGEPILVYSGYKLVDHTEFCEEVNNQQYTDFVIDWMSNGFDLSVFDGVASDGVVEYPRGTALSNYDIDLDRSCVGNGGTVSAPYCNDWIEHGILGEKNSEEQIAWADSYATSYGFDIYSDPGLGNKGKTYNSDIVSSANRTKVTSWMSKYWLDGVNKILTGIRQKIGNNKIIFVNSSRFHIFDWDITNGLFLEHQEYSGSFFYKKQIEKWMKVAPSPHVLHYGANMAPTRDNYKYMRFHLVYSLFGDAYFEATDRGTSAGADQQHWYVSYYDEFDTDLGQPTTDMVFLKKIPIIKIGGKSNDAWVRFFDNGAIILNASSESVTITDEEIKTITGYDGPYYRFQGGQDPITNNGSIFTDVTLSGRKFVAGYIGDGIILLKESKTIVSEIIIDNIESNTSPGSHSAELNGNWKGNEKGKATKTWTQGKRRKDVFHLHYTEAKNAEAIFKPTIGVAGNYEVFEWHGDVINKKVGSTRKTMFHTKFNMLMEMKIKQLIREVIMDNGILWENIILIQEIVVM